jgi:hypothetical protein
MGGVGRSSLAPWRGWIVEQLDAVGLGLNPDCYLQCDLRQISLPL